MVDSDQQDINNFRTKQPLRNKYDFLYSDRQNEKIRDIENRQDKRHFATTAGDVSDFEDDASFIKSMKDKSIQLEMKLE